MRKAYRPHAPGWCGGARPSSITKIPPRINLFEKINLWIIWVLRVTMVCRNEANKILAQPGTLFAQEPGTLFELASTVPGI